ncbi:MAG: Rrf2 family transcriptional regulator [Candidatus Aminicenantes bacterium]|nr:Rrf2 family transcriptional regulator [Candidatus Aminicenantes bacterium]
MLSKKAKYAIIALVNLARRYEQGPALIRDIAREERIPRKFLELILLELKKAGILGSKKGKGGGYYLTKHPGEVDLATIMRLFDGPIGMIPCVTYKYYEPCEECKTEVTCGIRSVFKELRDETVRLLKQATLSEIIRRENQLDDQMEIEDE